MASKNKIPYNDDVLFSKQMRTVTRDVHDLSDALVNAKLVLAMSDNNVWIEGLLIFYELFKFLETAMDELSATNKYIATFNIDSLKRTKAFEDDLNHYLGSDWKLNYKPRESVVKYIKHLEEIKNKNPTLLIAYIYHMYLGVLSGGQIISRKRKISFLNSKYTDEILFFPSNISISLLKKNIKNKLDEISLTLKNDIKEELLYESRQVFLYNNSIIRTVNAKYIYIALIKKIGYVLFFIFILRFIYVYLFH